MDLVSNRSCALAFAFILYHSCHARAAVARLLLTSFQINIFPLSHSVSCSVRHVPGSPHIRTSYLRRALYRLTLILEIEMMIETIPSCSAAQRKKGSMPSEQSGHVACATYLLFGQPISQTAQPRSGSMLYSETYGEKNSSSGNYNYFDLAGCFESMAGRFPTLFPLHSWSSLSHHRYALRPCVADCMLPPWFGPSRMFQCCYLAPSA